MFLFVIGIGGIITNVIFVSVKYFSYPVSMRYTLNDEPFEWPEFTFCNPSAPFHMKANSSERRY